MKVTIRPATTEDRPTIEAASRQTWDEHRDRQPYAFAENGWDYGLKRAHEMAFRDPKAMPVGESGNLYVADAGGQVVGFVLLSWHARPDVSEGSDGSIFDIWVHPDWRGKGVGRNLVDIAREVSEQKDWDSLTADVWTGAPSAELFEIAGFTPMQVRWRIGPDRAARPIEPREKPTRNEGDSWWKWAVLIVLMGLLVAVVAGG